MTPSPGVLRNHDAKPTPANAEMQMSEKAHPMKTPSPHVLQNRYGKPTPATAEMQMSEQAHPLKTPSLLSFGIGMPTPAQSCNEHYILNVTNNDPDISILATSL